VGVGEFVPMSSLLINTQLLVGCVQAFTLRDPFQRFPRVFGIRKRVTYILVLFGCAGMTGRETVETVPGVCDVAITQLKESVGEFVPSTFPSD
jgi:hypothetical protein